MLTIKKLFTVAIVGSITIINDQQVSFTCFFMWINASKEKKNYKIQ